MKIHLFILPSYKKNAGIQRTIDSFPLECLSNVNGILNYKTINDYAKTALWFGVFYDNEYIDKAIRKNLKTFLMTVGNNALVLFKKNYEYQTADFMPRIFRSGIKLSNNFATEQKIQYEKILNGWICEHGYSYICKI